MTHTLVIQPSEPESDALDGSFSSTWPKKHSITTFTLDPERWIEIRHFLNDCRSRSSVAFTPVLDPAPIPLLNQMYIGHDVTAPHKELKVYVAKIKGHDYSAPLLEILSMRR